MLTGVYGSGKSSVAEEIAYLLEQRGEPYALLDLDYLSWAGTGTGDHAAGFELMLQNLAAVAASYRRAGIRFFVLAYFVRSPGEVQRVQEAAGMPLRVLRLTVQLPVIERRVSGDVRPPTARRGTRPARRRESTGLPLPSHHARRRNPSWKGPPQPLTETPRPWGPPRSASC